MSLKGRIVLRDDLSPAVEFSVLVHETAHELLHTGDRRANTSTTVRETEAEAVAFVVSRAIGLNTGTAASDYIQLYSGDKDTLLASLSLIQRVATEILGALQCRAWVTAHARPQDRRGRARELIHYLDELLPTGRLQSATSLLIMASHTGAHSHVGISERRDSPSFVETPRDDTSTPTAERCVASRPVSASVVEWAMPYTDPDRPITERETGLGVFSAIMQEFVRLASRVAAVDSTILIVGESGVGKERLARFIHDASPRAHSPFVPVNCGALPDALFESELFGHARGAFTGAMQDRPGLFESADRGTLLLDEVGDVPMPLQVKLLRALQEHESRRVGENRQRKSTNVRVIAATNRDLAQDVSEGRFRKDLYYRLKVVELEVPPLRARPDDLRGLTGTILTRVAAQMKRPITGYAPEALEHMLRYAWPGNIRELENAIERACALATSERVELAGLPDEVRQRESLVISSEHVRPLREIEREYILRRPRSQPRQSHPHRPPTEDRSRDVVPQAQGVHERRLSVHAADGGRPLPRGRQSRLTTRSWPERHPDPLEPCCRRHRLDRHVRFPSAPCPLVLRRIVCEPPAAFVRIASALVSTARRTRGHGTGRR